MSAIRAKVRENGAKATVSRKKTYDSSKKRDIKQSFEIGDKVYWKKPIVKRGRSPKLAQIWQGPFIIKSKLSDLNYVIHDENNTNVTVHVNNLKLCLDDDTPAKAIGKRGRPRKVRN